MSLRIPLAIALVALCSARASAQAAAPPPILSSRVGIAKPTGIVAPGKVQVEAGYSHSHTEARTRHVVGETTLRLGLGHDTELRLGLPSYQRTITTSLTTAGVADASFALKHRLRTARGLRPALAISAGATLPTGERQVSSGAAQPEAALAAEWTISPAIRGGAFLAHRSSVLQDDRFGVTTAALAGRALLGSRTLFQLDAARVHSARAGGTETTRGRATLALRLTSNLQLDAWGERASTAGTAEHLVGLGLARRW
ncbi:MAG TPA: transporter [Longimicrobium sp.]|jgi:hypothetical protein